MVLRSSKPHPRRRLRRCKRPIRLSQLDAALLTKTVACWGLQYAPASHSRLSLPYLHKNYRGAPHGAIEMAIEIRVPTLGESITEAPVGKWFKKAGEPVHADEPLVELETDKVTLEVNAPSPGVLSEIVAETGQTVAIGALLGQVAAGAATPARAPAAGAKLAPAAGTGTSPSSPVAKTAMPPAPAAARIAAEDKIDLASITGSGKRGQVLKGDV